MLSGHDAKSSAALQLSRAMAKYREDRRLSAVLLNPRGRKRGSGGLRKEQELIITGRIRKFYLARERRPVAALSRLGPLSEGEGTEQMGKLLEAFKATRIVVGHAVQKGRRIRPRFGDKVSLVDTGMLSSYYPGGRASAMEICGGAKSTAQYMDGQQELLESAESFAAERKARGTSSDTRWGHWFRKASRLTGRGSMFRNDGRIAIRARGYVGRPWG